MDSRQKILSAISRRCSHDESIGRPRINPPTVGDITAWQEKLRKVYATVDEINDLEQAVDSIRAFVNQCDSKQVVLSPDPALTAFQATLSLKQIDVQQRQASADDQLVMTSAYAGVIETGSLVLLSSPKTPTEHNFLPEYVIVVVHADRLVPSLESLWTLMDAEQVAMPRALNLVSGPSKTADIEQTLVYGAHGPKALHVLLVNGETVS